MFAYGTNDFGETRCVAAGTCKCLCETPATLEGTCSQTKNSGYRLYKYDVQGIKYFKLKREILFRHFAA